MRKLYGLILVVALAGCLDLKQARVTPEHRQLLNKATVVVFLDPAPRLQHLQLSALDSTVTTATLKDWDADAVITPFLAQRMQKMGLDVHLFPYAHDQFPNPYDSSMAYPNFERMRGPLAAWGKDHGVDMVVAVYRQLEQDFIGESIENLVGYGVVRHGDERTDAYAAVYVDAINTKDAGLIGNSDGLKDIPMDNAAWRETYSVDKTPVAIKGEEAKRWVAKITEALTGAVLLAAQEAGLSH